MSYTQVQKFKLVRFISLVSRTISRDNIPWLPSSHLCYGAKTSWRKWEQNAPTRKYYSTCHFVRPMESARYLLNDGNVMVSI